MQRMEPEESKSERRLSISTCTAREEGPGLDNPGGPSREGLFPLRVLIPTKDDDTIWFLIIFAMLVCRTRKGR
jgi:hypothetical protein